MKEVKRAIAKVESLEELRATYNNLLASIKDYKPYIGTSNFHSVTFPEKHKDILISFVEKYIEDINEDLIPLKERLEILEKLL